MGRSSLRLELFRRTLERFHYFEGPHFKFFFGPDVEAEGGDDDVTEENVPVNSTSL
jgi:hypothetical protein